jgi:hypothetical protein
MSDSGALLIQQCMRGPMPTLQNRESCILGFHSETASKSGEGGRRSFLTLGGNKNKQREFRKKRGLRNRDESCLAFHKTARRVQTASLAQVRRPVYHPSVNRWDHCAEDRNMSKVWFITGAGRGMGVDIAKAALATGIK